MAKFTLEEKLNAVQRYLNGEGGYKYVAKTMNTAYSTIQKWVFQYRKHGLEGLTNSYTKILDSLN
ncbi:helix-turn-helix domain-containing protein [Bacillus sp. JJ1533]|uniref:helix-turn-helix domain-containing protein n=1 Tax=Bacillus sp. JJ1533 TaxID=3122959 RepID=UPI003F68ADC7